MTTLSVIVVNYRTPDLTLGSLHSLVSVMEDNSEWRAIVVDNCSNDESADKIEAGIKNKNWDGWAKVVRSSVNGGFAAGNNIGFAADNADYFLLLNSDAMLLPRCLEILLRVIEEDSAIGFAAPRLQGKDGTPQINCFRYHSPMSEFLKAAGTGPLDGLFSRFVVPMGLYNTPMEPD